MGISYNAQERVFRLDTPHSTYLIGIVDEDGFLGHIYYGKRIPDDNMHYLLRVCSGSYTPFREKGDQAGFLNDLPVEYSGCGLGDFRESCLRMETKEGFRACGLTYADHRIFGGKPALPGLPAAYGGEDDCATLELTCCDKVLGLTVRLYYTAFEKLDAICRSVQIENSGTEALKLTTVLSACLDLDNRNFDMLTLHGSWAYERMICRKELGWGKQRISSNRGISSHQEQPFMALVEHTATQTQGQVYAMNFVYSGNFMAQAETSQQEQVRMVMGIDPEGFSWRLSPGDIFQAPEVVMAYSDCGLGGMTRTFHDLYRGHLIRGPYKDKARPSLVNNWEATYFDFDTDKLLDIARTAAESGIEMLVVDDGWFGHRDNDRSSLGDWYVNEKKLPGGLDHLVRQVNALGLKFGIWVEPEMISPDSDLYRAHPDYALQIPGRPGTLGRWQLVLDMLRQDVRDCVYEQLYKILSSANIEYVKWDMNRPLTDVASFCLDDDRQGELYHRYVLGVYEMQERLLRDFPHLLLENCASGGGRFDPGMLYYSPQIWTSDNTDAIDRLRIQYGTSFCYPVSAMGAHVSAVPNGTTGRVTPMETRGVAAMHGTFGYEMDLSKCTSEEKETVRRQTAYFKEHYDLIQDGDYYRLSDPFRNSPYTAWEHVSHDKREALVSLVTGVFHGAPPFLTLRVKGLDPALRYRINGEGSWSGDMLMQAGWPLPILQGDYQALQLYLEAE